MHDNLIREREGGRLPLEVRLGSQVDIVTQMTKWTRNINLTLNIGLRVSGLSFGFSGSPCFFIYPTWSYTKTLKFTVVRLFLPTEQKSYSHCDRAQDRHGEEHVLMIPFR